jgi:hypothetical protein
MIVPLAANMPPTPWQTEIFVLAPERRQKPAVSFAA